MARKLAGLLASAPVISLPVVRLIREAMLKDSQQVHVAEVFLGGLLKPLSEIEVDTDPNYVQYGFIDGVRELLIDSVPTSSVLNVVEEVSKFVAKRIGLSLEQFAAVLSNSEQASDGQVIEQVKPFAIVTTQILRRLGREYLKVAERVAQQLEDDLKSLNASKKFKVIKVLGYGSAVNGRELREQIKKTIRENIQNILIDFEDLEFMDSSYLGELVNGYKDLRLSYAQGRFILFGLNLSVKNFFELTSLDKVFEIHEDIIKAKYALNNSDY